MDADKYYRPLIEQMHQKGNPLDAVAMKKYMRNQFEFFGLKKIPREEVIRKFTHEKGVPEIEEIKEAVKYLWKQPQRELQYYAMTLAHKRVREADRSFIDLLEYMILHKSWWDTIDYIAANPVGEYFKKYPGEIKTITGKWMDSGNFWLQRTALLFQLRYKKDTDFDLLVQYINRLEHEKEFFIRKAIGWILREYSKTEAQKVIWFVENSNISEFSKKEALKWLKKKEKLNNPEF